MDNKELKNGEENHPAAFLGGGAAGAVAGATVGSIVGPVGTAIGAAVGGLVGATTGESIASMPAEDEEYWRENYSTRSYAKDDVDYEAVAPAYRAGYSSAATDEYSTFEDAESDVRERFESTRSDISWDKGREAARDAFNRTIELREERLRAEKERVETGEVSLRKEVVTESQTLTVPVEREEVVIERRPLSGKAASGDIGNEEIARVTVSEERVRLEKDVVPVEEVSLGKRTLTESQEVSGEVRKETLKVDKTGNVRTRETKED